MATGGEDFRKYAPPDEPPYLLGDGVDVWTTLSTGAPSPRDWLLLETHPDRAYALDSDSDSDSDASFVSAKSCQSAASADSAHSGNAPVSPRCVPSSLPPVLEATSSVLLRGDLFDRKRQCVVTGAVLVQVFELLEADTRKVLTKFELPEPLTPAHLEPYMVDSESESEGEDSST
jgi:hypothetical protein